MAAPEALVSRTRRVPPVQPLAEASAPIPVLPCARPVVAVRMVAHQHGGSSYVGAQLLDARGAVVGSSSSRVEADPWVAVRRATRDLLRSYAPVPRSAVVERLELDERFVAAVGGDDVRARARAAWGAT